MARTLFALTLLVLAHAYGERARQELSESRSRSPNPGVPKSSQADAHVAYAGANGEQAKDLKIRLELECRGTAAAIEWDTALRVLLVNESDRQIRIWDPNSQRGWRQFAIHFLNL